MGSKTVSEPLGFPEDENNQILDESLNPSGSESNFNYLPYHTRSNPPVKIEKKFTKPTKVQVNPFDAQSPQDVLKQHGMYRDDSIYTKNPNKIYADLTIFEDYQTMLNKSIQAEKHFNSLDVDIKAKFNNNPLEFAQYLASDKFDVNEILTEKERVALRNYLDEQEREKQYQEYIQSDEYKNAVAEYEAYARFNKEQFDKWRKTNLS